MDVAKIFAGLTRKMASYPKIRVKFLQDLRGKGQHDPKSA